MKVKITSKLKKKEQNNFFMENIEKKKQKSVDIY